MSKVAIIGGGASGIISAKILLDRGFNVTTFEKTNNVAGVWNYNDKDGALYKNLRTNLPKEIMVFENQQIPYKSEQSFISYQDVRKYLEQNAKVWQIDKHVCLNSEVISLNPLDKLDKNPVWRVTYIKDQIRYQEDFEFIIVANGHYNQPKIPQEIVGLDSIDNKNISHSKYYRSPNNHGRRVMCVGYSSSGMDISRELFESGREVYVSLRNLDNKKESYNLNDVKRDIKFTSSLREIICAENECIVITDNGNKIHVDEVIFCTGYKYDFPFLSCDLVSTDNNIVQPLLNQLLHERYLNLGFIGLPWKTLPFVLSECQAIFLACFWSQSHKGQVEILANMEDSQSHKTRFEDDFIKYFHMLGDQQWTYNLNLLDLVGQKTIFREQRIKLIEQVYNNVHELKLKYPFSFRDAVYKVDYIQNNYTRISNHK
ncbi:hypothetical protein LO80_00165 [Candidatus Francisella endociliophora]|uniref:Monooxygenase n=1 Tax=Candidatus Francisella endociliophora TaxID=653937 RepID=A0A097ELU4_9GAMM|nr:NAD(P)-binding domain-containing protein [Francisella sp. FSC1006]AIT08540.1 hypothetical protein LO80_00165 [Francisella sp. FSC1006]